MKAVLDLVQTTLDTLLLDNNGQGVYSFWGRRFEISANESEYIIYSWIDDSAEVSADGDLYYRTATVALQYYVKYAIARTYAGRQATADRMDAIREAMREAGFGCSGGWSEIGDVDDVGFATFRSEYSIPHLTGGE